MSKNWTRVVRWLGIDLTDQEMLNSKSALRKIIKINPVTQQNPERPGTWGPRCIWGGGEGGTKKGRIVGKLMNSKSCRAQSGSTLPDCSGRRAQPASWWGTVVMRTHGYTHTPSYPAWLSKCCQACLYPQARDWTVVFGLARWPERKDVQVLIFDILWKEHAI